MKTGVFALSLDFELIWGTLDLFGPDGFRDACRRERAAVRRLLDTLERHEISATWCVVGHLFLDRCDGRHAEMPRPSHAWVRGDWFRHDPGGKEEEQPLFLARSLVERIRACPVAQEIGSHSFSHSIFGDSGCTREVAAAELAASVAAARELGLDLRSFAFPRNRVGHLDLLREHGFVSYRGPGSRWYERDDEPGLAGRLAHLWDVMTAATPAPVVPERTDAGLWNIPGSMIYFPMHGIRRFIPVERRVARVKKGLREAVRRRQVFHLWFHPTNLADETERMFAGLDSIFEEVACLRARGDLKVLTMSAIAEEAMGTGDGR